MSKYPCYVGVTETSDPGVLDNWKLMKLHRTNVIITKHLESPQFRQYLVDNQSKIILHHTITGWGGTEVESGVESMIDAINHAKNLFDAGFDPTHYVLRIDPIIPTEDGIHKFIEVVNEFMDEFKDTFRGGVRARISVLDLYSHAKSRLNKIGIDLSEFYNGFNAKQEVFDRINIVLDNFRELYPIIKFYSCAEPKINSHHAGCVSQEDIDILGKSDEVKLYGSSHQRKTCMCPDNKVQLLGSYYKSPKCTSNCKYCYLKNNKK